MLSIWTGPKLCCMVEALALKPNESRCSICNLTFIRLPIELRFLLRSSAIGYRISDNVVMFLYFFS